MDTNDGAAQQGAGTMTNRELLALLEHAAIDVGQLDDIITYGDDHRMAAIAGRALGYNYDGYPIGEEELDKVDSMTVEEAVAACAAFVASDSAGAAKVRAKAAQRLAAANARR